MKKKVLITTIPVEHISSTARHGRKHINTNTVEDCFHAANNIEFINGFTLPNYATRFLKANIPSIDILEYPTWEEYGNALKQNYDAVGISFWTYSSQEAIKMANLAKQEGIKEVWGGGHGISTPGIEKHFDRVFKGYSEYELKPLIEGIELSTFTHPTFTSKYDFFLQNVKTGYLFSIRGCRMPCTFCSGPRYYERLALTPIEELERLLDVYIENGVRHITVVDETFLQNMEHAKQIINAMKRRNLTWTCTSRIDRLVGNIKELKQNGLQNVYIGIESMNNASLQSIKKGSNENMTVRLLEELKENDSFAFGTYMICLEHDTIENVKENVDKLNEFVSLYGVVFWIATPFPGTDYYDELDQKGLIIDKNWNRYDALNLVVKHKNISPSEGRLLLKYCTKSHCHPLNIRKIKILRKWEKLEKKETSTRQNQVFMDNI